ncbi:MAG: hypothetical protein ETSY2_17740 [Candidatus Entotheonella gemina]|uniref:Uncharacterized protein n=1 Tax=Candidatus Entotheonella gemina TaxID=1429439 RepID=W4M9Q1_9BACT|nr:MAG: hypothetical protein ETSY2_17740 [Candidatus Entotheonella gemina]
MNRAQQAGMIVEYDPLHRTHQPLALHGDDILVAKLPQRLLQLIGSAGLYRMHQSQGGSAAIRLNVHRG